MCDEDRAGASRPAGGMQGDEMTKKDEHMSYDETGFVSISEARGRFNELARKCTTTGRPVVVFKGCKPYVVIEPYRRERRQDGCEVERCEPGRE